MSCLYEFQSHGVAEFLDREENKIDPTEREKPSLALVLEKVPELISVPRSER